MQNETVIVSAMTLEKEGKRILMNAVLQFLADPSNNLLGQTLAFLRLCLVPIGISAIIGITIGVLVYRNPALAFIAVNLSDLMRAIPVLAVLFLFVPIFHVGFPPAAIALTLLGIPPVLLNTYEGLHGIDPSIIEAARGMGMTGRQIMSRIQTPLVLPLLAAGLRVAAVQIVATAPLGGLIGAGGYGDYIIDGVYTLNTVEILAGSLLVAALAILIEVGMEWVERRLTPEGVRIRLRAEAQAVVRAARP
jgi:osmoprotectant transport system permease protein